MKRLTRTSPFVFTILLCATTATFAQLRMPAVFGDHMVLQQQSQVAIWGWAGPMEQLTVKGSWNQEEVKVKALNSGNWKTLLNTPAAGGPFTVSIKGTSELIINDVMIGEVWICSGQSNMEWSMNSSAEGPQEIPAADFPQIRLFRINRSAADYPQMRGEGEWQVCSPETVKGFSAVGYFFGKKLHTDLKVPVGLISSSWGGTPAEVWTPKEKVESDPALLESAAKQKDQPWGPRQPGVVYNSMIRPLVPYGIAGTIWYQGEANTVASSTYARLMTALIGAWRSDFGKEFPFYYVQIAPYNYGRPYEGVLVMDQQTKLRSVPKTGMVVVSDVVDDVKDIHPKRKKPVGERLANYALAATYQQPLVGYQSPVYKSMQIEKAKIRISFDYVTSLASKGEPGPFLIAGEDGKFVPAQGKIDGATIIVSSKEVKKPVAVRFCWDNTAVPNLFNKEGLPVAGFRTDDWVLGN